MRLPHLIGKDDRSTRPPLDRLFVLSYARSRLEREHQLTPRDIGAIVFTRNYQSGTFYPIAPTVGSRHRDTQRERRLKGQLRADDTVQPELGAWF